MQEFDTALHHHIIVKRKKRLIVLMALDDLSPLDAADAGDNTATLRQYLRQYTYIDYRSDDWLDNLLYALPLRGMDSAEPRALAERDGLCDDDDTPLLTLS